MNICKKNLIPADINEVEHLLSIASTYPWIEKRLDEYEELRSFCDTKEQRDLIYTMIKKFTYLSISDMKKEILNILSYIEKKGCTPQDTIFYAFSDDRESDSSQVFLYYMKTTFPPEKGWKAVNFCGNIVKIKEHDEKYKNVFLVDDFSGSAQKVKSKYNFATKEIQNLKHNCSIEVILLAAMNKAEEIIGNRNIPYFSVMTLERGLSDNYTDEELKIQSEIMLQLEQKLEHSQKCIYFPFGKDKSEALFYIDEFNIPNNVFPIFWWEKTLHGIRNTMFTRKN